MQKTNEYSNIYISTFGKGIFENINIFEEIYMNKDLKNRFIKAIRLTDDNKMDRHRLSDNLITTLHFIYNEILIKIGYDPENIKIHEEQSPLTNLLNDLWIRNSDPENHGEEFLDSISKITKIIFMIEYAKFIQKYDKNSNKISTYYNGLYFTINGWNYDIYKIIQLVNDDGYFAEIHASIFYDIIDDFIVSFLINKSDNPLCNLSLDMIDFDNKIVEKKTIDKIKLILLDTPDEDIPNMIKEFIKFIKSNELDGSLRCENDYNNDHIYPIKLHPNLIEYRYFAKDDISALIGFNQLRQLRIDTKTLGNVAFMVFHLLKNYMDSKGE